MLFYADAEPTPPGVTRDSLLIDIRNLQGQEGELSLILNSSGQPNAQFIVSDLHFHTLIPPQWTVDGGGSWTDQANWTGAIPDYLGAAVGLLGNLVTAANAPAIIRLDGDRTVGAIIFDNTITNGVDPRSFIITPGTGGTLVLNNGDVPALLQVRSGQHEIQAAVRAESDMMAEVRQGAALNLSGGLTLDGKMLNKRGPGVLSTRFIRNGALSIEEGVVAVNPNSTDAGMSFLTGLSIANGAALDLADNDLAARNVTLANIQSLIVTGRNGGTWDGSGIHSSAAAADALGITGLAVVVNDFGLLSFGGLAVEAGDVLVKYTYNGDADVNGMIDGDDYFRIDSGFTQGLAGYRHGDFDYNGVVDGDDYFLIDKAFASQGAPLGGGVAAVPEPAAVAILSLAAMMGVRRRRSIGLRNYSGF